MGANAALWTPKTVMASPLASAGVAVPTLKTRPEITRFVRWRATRVTIILTAQLRTTAVLLISNAPSLGAQIVRHRALIQIAAKARARASQALQVNARASGGVAAAASAQTLRATTGSTPRVIAAILLPC